MTKPTPPVLPHLVIFAMSFSVIVGIGISLLLHHPRPTTPHQEYSAHDLVYDVCQRTRMSPTESEALCAEVQDQFHYQYHCMERNNLASNHCWVDSFHSEGETR